MTTVIPLRSNSAAAAYRTPVDPIHLHAQAENALAMALYYMRQPTSNMPGAMRKAVQALSALNTLSTALNASSDRSCGA